MAELTQKERLQPSLLDRLMDDVPEKKQESREKRILSIQQLRASVRRDLEWLLNTVNLETVQDLDRYPNVTDSVINYGVADLAGKTLSSMDGIELERMLRQVIWNYEPRLLRNTVKVKVSKSDDDMSINAMRFDIEGDLWAQPMPLKLYLKTEIDLETGGATIEDVSGSGI